MCPNCKNSCAKVAKSGFFPKTTGDSLRIQRYRCGGCHRRFSDQTQTLTYRERKPELTQKIMGLLMEGMSQRGCARHFCVTQKTISDKLVRLSLRAKQLLESQGPEAGAKKRSSDVVQFDEMETFEHSKCKPLSIALAVDSLTRKILAVEVASMPAKGKIAAISRKKYGRRRDRRKSALRRLMASVKRQRPHLKKVISDQCPRYPSVVAEAFPEGVEHQTHKGRRGCVVGQGELKRGGFDPLFSLNHTCAMFRCRIKRLSRRTWCTTKKGACLQYMVNLYAWWHNQRLSGENNQKIVMP